MEKIKCTECGRVLEDTETNHGTPELPCCLQCWSDAQECRYDLECNFLTQIEEKANVNNGRY